MYGALNFRRHVVGAAPRSGSAHFRLTPAALARATFCYPDSAAEPTDFALAAANPCPPERAALAALPADDPRTLVELFEDHPALRGVLDWPALLELLTPLRPRHYSISSSPAADPRHAC